MENGEDYIFVFVKNECNFDATVKDAAKLGMAVNSKFPYLGIIYGHSTPSAAEKISALKEVAGIDVPAKKMQSVK